MPEVRTDNIAAALRAAYPELAAVREAAGEEPVYLVGGAVRDLLLGRERSDVDLVVVGDAAALAARLGADPVEHERFATAKVTLDGHQIDIATARTESYPQPGALPEVAAAADIDSDLSRRDFSINAMALALHDEGGPIDPHHGREDLRAGRLRVLHQGSFMDDPTRAVRAARYASRFGFELAPRTAALIHAADLGAVSADRRRAELLRLAAEPGAARGFALLADWGLLELREEGAALTARVAELLASPPWRGVAPRDLALLAAALGPPGGEEELAAARPPKPSLAVELAARHEPVELVLGRALGADWLDRYLEEWRSVHLEIDGEDLIAAGVSQGPAIGKGLDAALRAKLDGEISGRDEELGTALRAARRWSG
jgi:tRNA nucleotidyltransferase (CCA-adding enzyme)